MFYLCVIEISNIHRQIPLISGPPPDSPELNLNLSIRGTGVNQSTLVEELRKIHKPNSSHKPSYQPTLTTPPQPKPPARVSTQESDEERAAVTEIEAILNLKPESRSSDSTGIETQPSSERPLNRPR